MSLVARSFTEFTSLLHEYIDPNESEADRIIRENDIEGLIRLLETGFNIETQDAYGRTLLENAAIHDRVDLIRALHNCGHTFIRGSRNGIGRGEIIRPLVGEIRQQRRDQHI
jgi:hypothetical protein